MVNQTPLNAELLLYAYRQGIFPMANSADAALLRWYDPPERTIFPLDAFHVPRRLRRRMRQKPYHITCNRDFPGVITGCADLSTDSRRTTSWINQEIIQLYTELHALNHAHSLEAWHAGRLVGGLYGVQIGKAFFGESMFSLATDASKICLVYLVAMLRRQDFRLLDCQFSNAHLDQFGAQTISREDYHERLAEACALQGAFPGAGAGASGDSLDGIAFGFLQAITQAS